jgi:hypothetical protein
MNAVDMLMYMAVSGQARQLGLDLTPRVSAAPRQQPATVPGIPAAAPPQNARSAR